MYCIDVYLCHLFMHHSSSYNHWMIINYIVKNDNQFNWWSDTYICTYVYGRLPCTKCKRCIHQLMYVHSLLFMHDICCEVRPRKLEFMMCYQCCNNPLLTIIRCHQTAYIYTVGEMDTCISVCMGVHGGWPWVGERERVRFIGLGGCWITGWLLLYFNMVTVPHKMVGLERMSDYRGFTVAVWLLL